MLKDILLIHGSGPKDDLVPAVKEIIVDLSCGAAILRGADIYAPGVLAAHPGKVRFHSVFSGVKTWCLECCTSNHSSSLTIPPPPPPILAYQFQWQI